MQIITKKINEIKPYEKNPRKNDEAAKYVANSIKEFGFKVPIVIDKDGVIIAGHTRYKAAKKLKMKEVPCIMADDLTDEQVKAFRLADNKVGEMAEWDNDLLSEELDGILSLDMGDFGFGDDDILNSDEEKKPISLQEEYVVVPFSVLNAEAQYWKERKAKWMRFIHSGDGRDEGLCYGGLTELTKKTGKFTEKTSMNGTSIFDPVLCEAMIQWFSNRGDKIIDPFAGGSVRGLVSSFLDRDYYGCDLSEKQIKANRENYDELADRGCLTVYGEKLHAPKWYCGDSAHIDDIIKEDGFDMLLTCPPYGDLEVYSDDPNDISNMPYDEFLKMLNVILCKGFDKLKPNSFAVVVIGDIRDKHGYYRNLTSDTIEIALNHGLKLYNNIILRTTAPSQALIAGSILKKTRKIAKVHQDVLCFKKIDEKDDIDKMQKQAKKLFNDNEFVLPVDERVLCFVKGNEKEIPKLNIDKYDIENAIDKAMQEEGKSILDAYESD